MHIKLSDSPSLLNILFPVKKLSLSCLQFTLENKTFSTLTSSIIIKISSLKNQTKTKKPNQTNCVQLTDFWKEETVFSELYRGFILG